MAAKYADVVQLPELLDDPDETVRWSAALRLPQSYLLRLIHDPHREVRIRVASRLDAADLILMMKDPDYYVRQMVAKRIPGHLLRLMIRDEDSEVRRVVAEAHRSGVDNAAHAGSRSGRPAGGGGAVIAESAHCIRLRPGLARAL